VKIVQDDNVSTLLFSRFAHGKSIFFYDDIESKFNKI